MEGLDFQFASVKKNPCAKKKWIPDTLRTRLESVPDVH